MAYSRTRFACTTWPIIARRSRGRSSRFSYGEADPDEQELQSPEQLLKKIRASVERRLGPDRLETWIAWGLDVAALSRGLRGGCLPDPELFTQARQDARDLLHVLCSIPAEVLPCVQQAGLRSHGDPTAWGAEALRAVAWKREVWLAPLADLLQLPEDELREKRLIRMILGRLEERVETDSEGPSNPMR